MPVQEIDPNWTLSEVQKHVAGQVLFEATTHFAAVYLPEKIRIRKAKARENPNLVIIVIFGCLSELPIILL